MVLETTTQEDAVRKFYASHTKRMQKLESCSVAKKIRKWIPRLGNSLAGQNIAVSLKATTSNGAAAQNRIYEFVEMA